MVTHEKLFTYGSLQEELVQKMLFGRILNGFSDKIKGYKLAFIDLIENNTLSNYPILAPSNSKKDIVTGIVFELSLKELLIADKYETEAYSRKKIKLLSGTECWVYCRPS